MPADDEPPPSGNDLPLGSQLGPPPDVDLAAVRAKQRVAQALFGAAATRDEAESRIDRYEVRSRLGAGGMGVVYEAWDPQLQRPVAIKVLHPGVAADEKARLRLTREARALARLSHPNVIGVYDVGSDRDRVFIAMELVDGETLTQWLTLQRRPWRDALDMLLAAGRGLAAAHGVELVHRDFKPDNVLIARDGRVRVLDFGLARATDADPAAGDTQTTAQLLADSRAVSPVAPVPTLTEAGMILGTPLYMAPEQLIDVRAVSPASDQYSFCVATYEAVYGQRPFAGTTLPSVIANVTAGKLRRPPPDAEVPMALFEALRRGLSTEPAARWPGMEALLERLAELLQAGEVDRRRGTSTWLVGGALAIGVASTVLWQRAVSSPTEPAVGSSHTVEAVDARPVAAGKSAGPQLHDRRTLVDPSVASKPMPPATSVVAAELATLPIDAGESASATGDAVQPTDDDTTAPREGPAPVSKARSSRGQTCHVHEDTYALLRRSARATSTLRHDDTCYACRSETRRSRIDRIGLSCAHYMVCGEVPPSRCQ